MKVFEVVGVAARFARNCTLRQIDNGIGGLHKRLFAEGLRSHGEIRQFSFHNPLSKLTRMAIGLRTAAYRAELDKSCADPSYADHRVWQDVYRPKAAAAELYVKATLDAQKALSLISFKEA